VSTNKRCFHLLVTLVVSSSFLHNSVLAAEFEYPELMVTPKASERLEMEAKNEAAHRWSAHIPIQVSALTTFAAGIIQFGGKDPSKDPDGRSPLAGTIIGGGWLATTLLLSAYYQPYSNSLNEVRSHNGKSTREQLTKERLSEEALERPAALARRLTWLSFLSNAGAGTYMLINSENNSLAMVADITAMVVSFAPIIFPYRWRTIADEQSRYKKKIYAPVATGIVVPDLNTGKISPGLVLAFSF